MTGFLLMEDVGSIALVVSGSEGTGAKGAAIMAHPKEKTLGRLGRGCANGTAQSSQKSRDQSKKRVR